MPTSLAVRKVTPAKAAPAKNPNGATRPPLALSRAHLAETLAPRSGASISPAVVRGLVRVGDLAIVAGIGYLLALAYVAETGIASSAVYIATIVYSGALIVIACELLGLHRLAAYTTLVRNAPRLLLGWTVAFAALTATLVLLKLGHEVSRVWLAAWYLAGGTGLFAARFVLASAMHHWARSGRLYQRAAIYGTGPVTEEFIAELEAAGDPLVRIAGVFDDRTDGRAPHVVCGYPRLGGIDALIAMSRTAHLDVVIVALPLAAEARLASVSKRLSVLPADIKLPARATRLRLSPRAYSYLGRIAMIDLHERPIADWGRVSKWLFDKIVATIALVALAPLMVVVAAAVRIDSRGPALFRQKRYGFNNELIEVYKFRSMYTDMCDAAAAKLVSKHDPRVTRVGRFIRKTSLDELPQFFNVIRGELSLVGPRPHALQAKAGAHLYDEVVDGYFARHKVKPGITGWAQINGWRGETDTEEKIQKRVEHDLYYIANWSVFLDLSILAKTPLSLLNAENAY